MHMPKKERFLEICFQKENIALTWIFRQRNAGVPPAEKHPRTMLAPLLCLKTVMTMDKGGSLALFPPYMMLIWMLLAPVCKTHMCIIYLLRGVCSWGRTSVRALLLSWDWWQAEVCSAHWIPGSQPEGLCVLGHNSYRDAFPCIG